MNWDAPLARPLKPKGRAQLRTLDDARAYALRLPKEIRDRQAWQNAANLLLDAAKDPTPAAISEATDQLALALFTTYRQDMSKL